ncbi:type II secretion system F family protein [Bacillus alkalisoli]|uniref:type II secretion system F family protein n=1 Tax=Bacillus alkalisoli TaxID=2011008 RepID=UPI000C239CE5|nr:type II secretion system F family protein [Bacillus alkalisoli]
MINFLLWLFSFLFFSSVGFLLLFRINKNKWTVYRRVQPYLSSHLSSGKTSIEGDVQELDGKNRSLFHRVVKPAFVNLRQMAAGKLPKQKRMELEKKLQAAGYPFGMSVSDFVLARTLLPLLVFSLFLLLFLPTSDEKLKVVFLGGIGGFFVYFYINYYLVAKSKHRTKLIDKAMPDFFDMLNISIEAGMGLDSALKKVCSQMKTPLSDEFLYALEDMKLGKSRRQAFVELRDRVPSDFLRSVMGSIIQADQMGIGLSKVLRTQTVRIREKQRFTAKEQAMKAPVKMLIPMVLFIFPTLFIVLLGPVVVNLVMQFM